MAKKEKHYIESTSEALSLAESIGTNQEEKVLVKKQQNHERERSHRDKAEHRRSSSNNSRLEKAKEAVRMRAARTKKRKAKLRKNSGKPQEFSDGQIPRRKGVSFA